MNGNRLEDLPQVISGLPAPERDLARRLLDVSLTTGHLVVPEEMRGWVESSFGSVESVETQRIIRVTNRITLEGTLFNGLRASRPLDTGTDGDLGQEILSTTGDPFCSPETRTTRDTFGRIRGRFSTTAANVAKYDANHAVVVFDEHDPLRISTAGVRDFLSVVGSWHREVLREDPSSVYLFPMWNCLWRAGGSIIHGHAQAVATSGSHYPRVERLRRDATVYRDRFGSDYFRDLAQVHRSLGLGILSSDGSDAYVHITPVKEREVVVTGPDLEGLGRTVGDTLTKLVDDLGMRSFNVAFIVPPASETEEDWSGFPAVARIVDRGDTSNRTSDVAAMELYAASVVASDPFEVARSLRENGPATTAGR